MRKLFGVGINEFADPSARLNGCINDTVNIRKIFVQDAPVKWAPENVRLLCDERATRLNIFERLDWCTRGWEGPGDQLIIQMSYHGSQVVDRDGDEVDDEQDEILCPYDFPDLWDSPKGAPDAEACKQYLGQLPKPGICDDDMAVFLKKIPEFVATALIIDACHSGSTDKDLRSGSLQSQRMNKFVPPPFDIQSRGMGRQLRLRLFGRKNIGHRDLDANPNVHIIKQRHILLSGCRDNQTSADAYLNGMYQGAMSWAFRAALEQLGYFKGRKPSWIQVHACMLDLLDQQDYSQVPQLTGPEDLLTAPVFGAC